MPEATSNHQCPNCKATITCFHEQRLRGELRTLGDELTRTRQRLETIKRSADSAEKQDADARAKLTQTANNATERAREAEKRGAATRAELEALRRGLGDMMSMLTIDVQKMQARDRQFEHIRTCAACSYTGELIGDHREYCARCGENVIAQAPSAEQETPASVAP